LAGHEDFFMTLSQRLIRAGFAFIVFGTAVALIPTNGNASAATDTCTVAGQKDYVGNSPTDTTPGYLASGGSLTLTASPEGSATAQTAGDGTTGFKTTISGTTVTTTTAAAGTTDLVTVSFSDGHTVTYTVTAG